MLRHHIWNTIKKISILWTKLTWFINLNQVNLVYNKKTIFTFGFCFRNKYLIQRSKSYCYILHILVSIVKMKKHWFSVRTYVAIIMLLICEYLIVVAVNFRNRHKFKYISLKHFFYYNNSAVYWHSYIILN